MPTVTFEEVYANAYVRQSIDVIVRKTINAYPMLNQSESDIRQELLIALNGRLKSFDPERSNIESFCRMTLESDMRKILRKCFSQKVIFERVSIQDELLFLEYSCDACDRSAEIQEIQMDVQSVLLSLTDEEKRICTMIMAGYSFRRIAEMMDITLVFLRRKYISPIRQRFIEFGFGKIAKNFVNSDSL